MCGICGKALKDARGHVDLGMISRMCDSLWHRGPDDSGTWVAPGVAFGHRRLSIIDVASGHQPLTNEDGTVAIVFNGEIYDFPELRRDLEARGHSFSTRSDTEAIVHLYEDLGERCVERLRGMFAFAVWDTRDRSLLLARDRVGKKPLYYADTAEGLTFASELKAVMMDPAVDARVDIRAVHDYLTYQYVPPPRTILTGARKLPPAHTLTWREGQASTRRYWTLSFADKNQDSEQEVAEEVRRRLADAVRVRLMSEVPLGAFLSGGIDSSIVVAMMAEASSEPVKTFSIGFEEAGFSELPYAREVASQYSTDHHEFIVRPETIEVLPELVWHFDEPFADSSALPTYYVARETRTHVTVALNGDGGDETFGGYERYLAAQLAVQYERVPRVLRRPLETAVRALPIPTRRAHPIRRAKRFLDAANRPPEDRYARWMVIFDNEMKDDVYKPEFRQRLNEADSLDYLRASFAQTDAADFTDRMLASDTETYLPGDLLVKVDRMSMAHSLEGRSPFLDHHVMEYAATIPANLKLRGSTTKYILKRAAADLLPEKIRSRGKQGFGVPIGDWFRGPLKPWLQELLCSPASRSRGYFRPEFVANMIEDHAAKRADHAYRLWALAMLELWHLMFVDKTLSPPTCAKVTLP